MDSDRLPPALAPLLTLGRERTYRSDHYPVRYGDDALQVFVVTGGVAARSIPDVLGSQTVVDYAPVGTVLLDGLTSGVWWADVIPLPEVRLSAISLTVARPLLEGDPVVSQLILRQVEQSRRSIAETLSERTSTTASQRVLQQLVRFAEALRTNELSVAVPMNQTLLAAAAGTSRQSANEALVAPKKLGLVEIVSGELRVPNLHRLRQFVRSNGAF
jgi:hypothetical protein